MKQPEQESSESSGSKKGRVGSSVILPAVEITKIQDKKTTLNLV
jgi:hypothetical protein